MKKIVSITLVMFLVASAIAPANAFECPSDPIPDINELITLAGKEARNGNYDLAYSYEDQLLALGVDILSYDDLCEFLSELPAEERPAELLNDINPPPNNSSVHFYKHPPNVCRYAANNQYYDVITITAVSWDDTSSWLHTHGTIVTTTPTVYSIVSNIAVAVFDNAMTIGASPVTQIFLTTMDILSAAGESANTVSSMSIGSNDGSCTYAIDMDVQFQWVRPHDNGDYILRVREAKYSEINYSVTVLASLSKRNGSTRTIPVSRNYETSYTPTGYGNLDRVLAAYENGNLVEYHTPAYTIHIGSRSVNIPSMTVPPYMELL